MLAQGALCRISPSRFLAECRKRWVNQGSFVTVFWVVAFWVVFSLCFFCTILLNNQDCVGRDFDYSTPSLCFDIIDTVTEIVSCDTLSSHKSCVGFLVVWWLMCWQRINCNMEICWSSWQAPSVFNVWHSVISGMNRKEWVAPNVDIFLQSGWFWATLIASFTERLDNLRSCWIDIIHVVRGRPGGLLQFSIGEAINDIFGICFIWHSQPGRDAMLAQ